MRPDSDDVAQGTGGLVLRGRVDCDCGEIFEGVWRDPSLSLEDMAEAPVADQECPSCGKIHKDEQWPGWAFRSEAG
jgi:hypothetical protein